MQNLGITLRTTDRVKDYLKQFVPGSVSRLKQALGFHDNDHFQYPVSTEITELRNCSPRTSSALQFFPVLNLKK